MNSSKLEPHNTDRLLTAEERQRVLVEWNATAVAYPRDVCLHQLIAAQVERTPDAVAVTFGEKQLTYRELFAQAKKLAAELRKAGAAPDRLIGVCMERSLEMVVALVAILKAGAAYVPLDPEYPAERLSFMMQDAAVPLLLTQESLAATLPPHRAKVICVDLDAAAVAPSGKSAGQPTAESLAYMIYTSGSTGRPKGALNTHRAIVNRLLWMQDEYRLTSEDAVLQKTPFSFDVSVWEFFWPLITGARLVVAEPGGPSRRGLPRAHDRGAADHLHPLRAIDVAHLPGATGSRATLPLASATLSAAAKHFRTSCRSASLRGSHASCTISTVRPKQRWTSLTGSAAAAIHATWCRSAGRWRIRRPTSSMSSCSQSASVKRASSTSAACRSAAGITIGWSSRRRNSSAIHSARKQARGSTRPAISRAGCRME
jgi:hypothetical protein